jgi:outer membrane biosynthesis protein TonB
LTSYRFTYGYPKFYPDVRDAQGKSLMAMPGDVVEFSAGPPDDGSWVVSEQAPPAPPEVESFPPVSEPDPVPAPAPEPEPAPEPVQEAPPAPAPEAPAVPVEPVQAPVEPAPAPPAAAPFVFPGFNNPPARA